MAYYDMSFSPYRDDILEGSFKIIEEDMKWVTRSLADKGAVILVAYPIFFVLALLKAIVYIIEQLQKPVKKGGFDYMKIHRGMTVEDMQISVLLKSRKPLTDQYCQNQEKKAEKAEKINNFRKYLYSNNLCLRGKLIKNINHNVSDEVMKTYLHTGEIIKPYITSHITFGDDINREIKNLLGSRISLRTDRFSKETYLSIPNLEFSIIEKGLGEIFYETITVKLDDIRKN